MFFFTLLFPYLTFFCLGKPSPDPWLTVCQCLPACILNKKKSQNQVKHKHTCQF
ncbi:hypothetical protein Hanom_Chr13g01186811 [Helianthus anomalus]